MKLGYYVGAVLSAFACIAVPPLFIVAAIAAGIVALVKIVPKLELRKARKRVAQEQLQYELDRQRWEAEQLRQHLLSNLWRNPGWRP